MPEGVRLDTERREYTEGRVEFEDVRKAIEARVRRVCGHWPDEEVIVLTTRMTRIHLKYRRFTSISGITR